MTGQNVSIAANATSANQLAGLLYEYLPRRTKMVVAAAAAAVGINITLIVGGVILLNDTPISQANRFPQIPEDITSVELVPAGRIIMTFRNTTGAAIIVNGWLVDVS
jgi:hypothetical protein